MTAKKPPAHPVVLVARALGIIVGLLLVLGHAPALWPAVGGLLAYVAALVAMRGSWPGGPGRAART